MVDHNGIDSLLHGPNSKFFFIGAAGVGALLLYEYRKGKLSAGTVVTDPAADTSGDYTDGYSASDYGYGYSDSGLSLASYTDPSTGAVISGSATGTTGVIAPATNQQWSQQVQAMLVQQGYDPLLVGAAIGHALLGTEMSADQWTIVQTGIALEGQPPQGMPVPKVTPTATPPSHPVAADGFYLQMPTGLHYNVKGGKLYRVSAKTVAQLNATHVGWTRVLINNPVFTLPRGNPYTI